MHELSLSTRWAVNRCPKGISGDFELPLLEVGAKDSKGRWTTIPNAFFVR